MEIGGGTRVYALLGDPVAHSLSPQMQNAGFRALGLDAVYVALRCPAQSLAGVMEALIRQGGGGNVTIPHKEAAAAVLAERAGYELPVCNTFWADVQGARGGETDSGAILAALARLGDAAGPWCLVGTGGSARAALLAARQANAAIAVKSRSPARAQELLGLAAGLGLPAAPVEACRVAINCTPLGFSDSDPLPVASDEIPDLRVALDLVYRRGETAWVRAVRASGRVAADGREVLLEQGAAAFECWFPRRRAPREVLRAAVDAALA